MQCPQPQHKAGANTLLTTYHLDALNTEKLPRKLWTPSLTHMYVCMYIYISVSAL